MDPDPEPGVTEFAGHASHVLAFVLDEKEPVGQRVHANAPPVEYEPRPQFSHFEAPATENVPAGQSAQMRDPASAANVPAMHESQAVLPRVDVKDPPTQGRQLIVFDVSANVPSGHESHDALPVMFANVPGPQSVHDDAAASPMNVPTSHGSHEIWPVSFWYDPAGHEMHAESPARGPYVPRAHGWHVLETVSTKDPDAQVVTEMIGRRETVMLPSETSRLMSVAAMFWAGGRYMMYGKSAAICELLMLMLRPFVSDVSTREELTRLYEVSTKIEPVDTVRVTVSTAESTSTMVTEDGKMEDETSSRTRSGVRPAAGDVMTGGSLIGMTLMETDFVTAEFVASTMRTVSVSDPK
eukprot:comp22448_c0_seq1/m.55180 comp22448_c0_seq1/g.55180  ORF comp22448_c0_seq1/g.55180 comp22448_c0_seq1/m.55180 type:complete len:354 (+) comp22448_c0_seq1:829-1890(+)